jgi:hypothetical protein
MKRKSLSSKIHYMRERLAKLRRSHKARKGEIPCAQRRLTNMVTEQLMWEMDAERKAKRAAEQGKLNLEDAA